MVCLPCIREVLAIDQSEKTRMQNGHQGMHSVIFTNRIDGGKGLCERLFFTTFILWRYQAGLTLTLGGK